MTPSPRYRLLDLDIDMARQRVERDGTALDVQGLSFQLLACLLGHGNEVVGFDALMTQVWAPAVVNEETVTQRVKLLRQALGDDGRNPRYIRSVRGRGYQLCAPPDIVAAVPVSRPRRWPWIAAAATLVVAVLAGAWLHWQTRAPVVLDTRSPLVQRAAYYAGIGQAENNERAIVLYREALQADPHDRDAQIGISRAFSARGCLYNGGEEDVKQGRRFAEQALATATHSAPAWAALGYADDCAGRIDDAIDGYEHALAIDPSDDGTRSSAAYLYQEKGRLVDALHANLQMHGDATRVRFRDVQVARELELLGFVANAQVRYAKGFQLNPDNVFANIAWPRCLFLQGRFDEAETALAQAMARHTPHIDLYLLQGELALQRGNRSAAAAAFAQAAQLRTQVSLPTTLATIYAAQPAPPAWIAQRVTALNAQWNEGQPWPPGMLEVAVLELARDDKAAAVVAIGKSVDAGFRDRAYLQTSPLFIKLAGDAGFAHVLDRIAADVARQRQAVLAARWRPADLPPLP